jgi:hypothetical protein
VFTARYALSPYIKQIRFVFKGLNGFIGNSHFPETGLYSSRDTAHRNRSLTQPAPQLRQLASEMPSLQFAAVPDVFPRFQQNKQVCWHHDWLTSLVDRLAVWCVCQLAWNTRSSLRHASYVGKQGNFITCVSATRRHPQITHPDPHARPPCHCCCCDVWVRPDLYVILSTGPADSTNANGDLRRL